MKKFWTIIIGICVIIALLCLVDTPAQAAEVMPSADCSHNWSNGFCSICNQACAHEWDEWGWCSLCDMFCYHESFTNGICDTCGYACEHYWEYGACWLCGVNCQHEWIDGYCGICDTYCYHESWSNGICATCQMPCYHQYDWGLFYDGVCMMCGQVCEHIWFDGFCYACNSVCDHSWFDGCCTICDVICTHSDTEGICSLCGKDANAAPTACLRGDFNNWAYEANMVPVDDNVLSIMVPVVERGTFSFSLLYDGETYEYYGVIQPNFQYRLNVGSNVAVDFSHPGTYVFYLDIQTMNLRVLYAPEDMYVRGSFNDWSEDLLLTDNGDGTFTTTMILEPGEYEFEVTDGLYYFHKLGITHTVTQKSYVTVFVDMYTNSSFSGFMNISNEPIIVVPNLKLEYPSLSFEDEILYNVYYTLDDATSIVEMGMITFNESLTDGAIDDAVEMIPGYVNSGSTYMVQSNGIPAKNLSDAVYFKVYAKLSDGSYVYSDVAGYHAVAYANTVLNNASSSEKAKALVVAMLNYGAAAQEYFGYKTDSLMNAHLTAEQLALVNAYDESMVSDVVEAHPAKVGFFVMKDGYSDIYPTVSFEGAFSINYYFTPSSTPDSGLTFYYWDAQTYAGVDVLTVENAAGVLTMKQDGKNYGAAVEGIAAKSIDETIYVAAAYTSDGVTYYSGVISYSLGKYCETIASDVDSIGAATAVYGYYAKNYFGGIG